ncbi:MAG: outer membrane protein assembly factor BamD [Fidelibacterota bacterium]
MTSTIRASIFILAAFFLMACGGRKGEASPQAMLEQAQSLIDESRYADAIQTLRKLVKTFPGDSTAARAQYMLGDTFMAYAKDFEQSVKEYRRVVAEHPQSRFAVNAQFMIGYIYANFIKDYDLAKAEYERFLEVFSDRADSNLVQSVRFELENLGKDLNEVPQLRHITS